MMSLVVDDSRLAASSLERVLGRVDPEGICKTALTAAEALEQCRATHVDVVFLDIEMPGTNGLELARKLKVCAPETNVVFVTGYPEYALDAWQTQASAFLVKPVDDADVRSALERLRVPLGPEHGSRLFVQCFGSFEVFYDGVPVEFERHHTKELMAYLVDSRGSMVPTGELVTALWEGLPDTASRRSQLRTLIADLRKTLEGLGYPDMLVKRRGAVAIKLSPAECDYYGFLRGLPEAINRYRGEYMRQYSWAEPTAALLAFES